MRIEQFVFMYELRLWEYVSVFILRSRVDVVVLLYIRNTWNRNQPFFTITHYTIFRYLWVASESKVLKLSVSGNYL